MKSFLGVQSMRPDISLSRNYADPLLSKLKTPITYSKWFPLTTKVINLIQTIIHSDNYSLDDSFTCEVHLIMWFSQQQKVKYHDLRENAMGKKHILIKNANINISFVQSSFETGSSSTG